MADRVMQKKMVPFSYDNDTGLGINNEGKLVYGYSLLDTDLVNGETVYTGQNSVFWKLVAQAFPDEIQSMYETLRQDERFSYEYIEQMFEEHQGKWPIALRNEDNWFCYILPFLESGEDYFEMCLGSKSAQRKWWLYHRFKYLDSMFRAGDAKKNYLSFRGYAIADFHITPYADIFIDVLFGPQKVMVRANRNTEYTIPCPLDNVSDTETAIYSADMLSSIGDMSGYKADTVNVAMGIKLLDIKFGKKANDYVNPNLKSIALGNNKMLELIELSRCVNLSGSQDFSANTGLKTVHLWDTRVTGVNFAIGGVLEELELPGTITNLTIRNQPNLARFSVGDVIDTETGENGVIQAKLDGNGLPVYANVEKYSLITTLRIENIPDDVVPVETIITKMPDSARVRWVGFHKEFDNTDQIDAFYDKFDRFRGLDENAGNTAKAQLVGTIHVPSAVGSVLAELQARYPYVVISATHSTSYRYYKNYDGTDAGITAVTCYDGVPQSAAPSVPNRQDTAEWDYTAVGWSTNQNSQTANYNHNAVTTSDVTYYAAYSQAKRSYPITFVDEDNTVLQAAQNFAYGTTPTYSGATPSHNGQTFTTWVPAIGPVTGSQTYKASYVVMHQVTWKNDGGTVLKTESVVHGNAATPPANPTSEVDASTPFSGWDKAYNNITTDTIITATYTSEPAAPTSKDVSGAYAVEWDYSNTSSVLTRKGLAASFADPVPATSKTGSGSSPFDSIYPWSDIKAYNVVNGAIGAVEGSSGFSYSEDTVIKIPEFYYTCWKDTSTQKWTWAISGTAKTGYEKHPGSGKYIGKYHANGTTSAITSKTGLAPLENVNLTNFRAAGKAKGTNWRIIDLAAWSALQMLYLVEFADFDSQTKLGTGAIASDVITEGALDGASYHTVKASNAENMYRGVVNPFSNVYQWTDGFLANNQVPYISASPSKYGDTTNGLTKLGFNLPTSNFISGFGYDGKAAWAFIPDASVSAESYVKDKVFTSSSGLYGLSVGGYYLSSLVSSRGLFCCNASNSPSYAYASIGSRLLFEAA